MKTDSLMDKPPAAELPEWSDTEVMPLIIIENSSVVEKPKTTDGLLPISSEILLPQSPEVTGFEDQDALSCPLSPNRVRQGHSQDMPAEGSIFDISPDVPGFNMRPAGGGVQPLEITQRPPSNLSGSLPPNPISFPLIPYFFSLSRSLSWGMESKHLEKSRYMASMFPPWSSISVHWSNIASSYA